MNPCEQEENIKDIQIVNKDILKNQEMLAAQHIELVQKLDGFFSRLEAILLADVERRITVDHLEKEVDTVFKNQRNIVSRIEAVEVRNAKCDGAGIFEKWDIVWNFIQQEKGWRRFIPHILTGIAALAAVLPYI